MEISFHTNQIINIAKDSYNGDTITVLTQRHARPAIDSLIHDIPVKLSYQPLDRSSTSKRECSARVICVDVEKGTVVLVLESPWVSVRDDPAPVDVPTLPAIMEVGEIATSKCMTCHRLIFYVPSNNEGEVGRWTHVAGRIFGHQAVPASDPDIVKAICGKCEHKIVWNEIDRAWAHAPSDLAVLHSAVFAVRT